MSGPDSQPPPARPSQAQFWIALGVVVLLGAGVTGSALMLRSRVQGRSSQGKDSAPLVGVGRLSLATQPRAEVYWEMKKLGDTPLVDLYLPVGKHRLVLVGPDGAPRPVEVSVGDNEVTKVELRLDTLAIETP